MSQITQPTYLLLGMQLAGSLGVLGKVLCKKYNDEDVIFIEEFITIMEHALCAPSLNISKVMQTFSDNGLTVIKSDFDKKHKFLKLSNALKLPIFAEFVANYNNGKYKILEKTGLSSKDVRVLFSLTRFARRMELNLEEEVKLNINDLKESLNKVTGTTFEISSINLAQQANLLKIENHLIAFYPLKLARIVSSFGAMKKLMALDAEE